jgi:hypothetical protein
MASGSVEIRKVFGLRSDVCLMHGYEDPSAGGDVPRAAINILGEWRSSWILSSPWMRWCSIASYRPYIDVVTKGNGLRTAIYSSYGAPVRFICGL